jgi:probable HAF family extracellular repeat protein
MRRSLWLLVGMLALASVAVVSSRGATQVEARWVITDLGTLGGRESWAYDISDRGQIVGGSDTKTEYVSHGFLWENGKMRDLGVLKGMERSSPLDINERGQIVGMSGTVVSTGVGGEGHAFLWEKGKMRDLGTLAGDRWSEAVGINDRGQVIGYSWTKELDWEDPQAHAFLWADGRMQAFGALSGDTFSQPVAINERGQVIGVSWRRRKGWYAVKHAFLWENGKMLRLGTLGGDESEPTAINERGHIVGRSSRTSNIPAGNEPDWHAFLWEKGRMRDLGTLPGGTSSKALEINDRAQIVGESETKRSSSHAFLWEKGKMRDLGAIGGAGSYVTAINIQGQILGYSLRFPAHSDPLRRDFLWQRGKAIPLWKSFEFESLTSANAFNEKGQIVGERYPHAVLWSLKR